MEVSTVFLRRVRDGMLVAAELCDDLTDAHLAMWVQTWQPAIVAAAADFRRRGVPRARWPQDLHWNWRAKAMSARGYLGHAAFAIVCDARLQGMMQVDLSKTSRLPRQRGRDLVYVELNIPREWFEKHLISDGDDDAIAGFPGFLATRAEPEVVSFGKFISLLRRRDAMTIEDLAARAAVEASELRETEVDECAEPSVVHRLAAVFQLPPKKVLQHFRLSEPRSAVVRENAVLSAAPSTAPLSIAERELLDALLRVLSESE